MFAVQLTQKFTYLKVGNISVIRSISSDFWLQAFYKQLVLYVCVLYACLGVHF